MTDPGMADATYIGPMTPELVEQILDKVGVGGGGSVAATYGPGSVGQCGAACWAAAEACGSLASSEAAACGVGWGAQGIVQPAQQCSC